MNLLLDTHVWLWWLANSDRLYPSFRIAINRPDNNVFVSAISLWELNIKRRVGKLEFEGDPMKVSIERGLEFVSFLPVHAEYVYGLPSLHGDPFDRALIAQAMVDDYFLLTADQAILKYPGVRLFG